MAETNDSVVKTAKLTKVFRDFWLREKVTAVADLDLDIRPREVFGLLGPNGSGKSTVLKMILGLLFPTHGQVAVFGKRATDVRVKSRIGFLPEESYLYPFLDAHETLDFYGRLFRQERRVRRRRIEMLLEMVGLTSVAYRRVGEYSKGMQRRIGLAQALINDPDLLILDEPTSGMDPIGTRQIKDLIRTLAHRGKTVLLSSHLLADVEDVCDRVCVLYGGRQRQLGHVEDLLAQQERTQITTDRLDEGTLLRDVTVPRDKLETLFLRIVEEAQSRRLTTGGALAGGQVAEFLRGEEEGRQVIEQLVAEAAEPAEAPPADAFPPPPRQDQNVLDALISTKPAESEAPEPAREDEKPTVAPVTASAEAGAEVDRGVLDELLGGKDDRGEDC